MDAIYLDYNASAQIPEELFHEAPLFLSQSFANPSSLHLAGRKSRALINQTADLVSHYLDCPPDKIFWTSGGSEANSWVLHTVAIQALRQSRKPKIILSSIEHESVIMAAQSLVKDFNAQIEWVRVDQNGVVDLNHLEKILDASIDLVSIMYANNETGVIQPVESVVKMCQKLDVLVHVDCVQVLGKIPLSLNKLGATYTTFSGHKIGAPKGVGFLVVTGYGQLLSPMIHGKQQKQLRAGTENSFGIALLGKVLQLKYKSLDWTKQLQQWHTRFEQELKLKIPGTIIYGDSVSRLPNTTYVGFSGIDGDGVLMNLDLEGVYASSGSACTSGSIDPSHVLLAMGFDKKIARSSVRFSSGIQTQWSDFERVLALLPEIVERVRIPYGT